MLTFENEEDNVCWMKLGDTCVLKAGKAISATEISQNINDDYIYPCYGGNGLRGYVKNYNQDGEHPLVGRQGALCGNVCYACNKFYATEHAIVVTPSVLYNEKFLYYLLKIRLREILLVLEMQYLNRTGGICHLRIQNTL